MGICEQESTVGRTWRRKESARMLMLGVRLDARTCFYRETAPLRLLEPGRLTAGAAADLSGVELNRGVHRRSQASVPSARCRACWARPHCLGIRLCLLTLVSMPRETLGHIIMLNNMRENVNQQMRLCNAISGMSEIVASGSLSIDRASPRTSTSKM